MLINVYGPPPTAQGAPGKSAYEVAVQNGFIGTEQEWLNSLSGGATHYIHEQGVPAATWIVTHNLGYKPGGIYVEDSGGSMQCPSVEHVSEFELELTFVGATDGFAAIS